MVKKKNELSRYPSFFFSKLVFRTISWTVFSVLFVALGKKWLETDILGKIYNSIFGGSKNFNQYFLGADTGEKSKLLNWAIFFLAVIIVANFISLLLNRYLWKKDKYIENNNYYLHNKWIFTLNTISCVVGAFLLTFSFVSSFTAILTLLFISFNIGDFWPRKKLKTPQTESVFSWKHEYVRKIIIYSAIVVLVVPFFLGRLDSFYKSATSDSPTGLAKAFSNMLSASPALKAIVNELTGDNFSMDFLFWFILIWFARGLIIGRIKEFGDFWTQVSGIKKKVSNFKHYYYYQESWALANNNLINLGDYSYLKNSPTFLSKSYLESDLDIDNFAKQNKKIVKYIEFCDDKIKDPSKRNFLDYCLFNEFSSWENCLRAKKLIKAARK